jgi:hypothetical protein
MAGIAAAVAVGAVVAGGEIAGSMAAKSAAKDAKNQQIKALNSLEQADVGDLNSQALAADRKRFEEQFKLQKDVDPNVAKLREQGALGVADGLKEDANVNNILKQLTEKAEPILRNATLSSTSLLTARRRS